MFYNAEQQLNGVGSLLLFDLSGEQELAIADIFLAGYEERGLFPLDIPGEPDSTYEEYSILLVYHPFLIVKSGYENFPFGSTPETRYKLGSFAPISGYFRTVDSEGNPTYSSVFGRPYFINYPNSFLGRYYCVVRRGSDVRSEYAISFPDPPDPTNPRIINYVSAFGLPQGDSLLAPSLQLNLTDGLEADLCISYFYGIVDDFRDSEFATYVYNL